MQILHNAKLPLLFAAALAALCVQAALALGAALQAKVLEQRHANAAIVRLKQQYEALVPAQQQWRQSFPSADQVRDVYAVYRLFDFESAGLQVNPDTLSVVALERVVRDGVDLGLTRVCAASGGNTSVQATATSYETLVAGARQLAGRAAVQMDGVTLEHTPEGPRMQMHKLCLLVRDAETER